MRRPSIHGTGVVLFLLLVPTTLRSQDNPQSVRVEQDVLWRRMDDSIQSLVRRGDAVIGIGVDDLTDQRSFFHNAEMAVLGELYRRDETAEGGRSTISPARHGAREGTPPRERGTFRRLNR